jgi:hypothetical protein
LRPDATVTLIEREAAGGVGRAPPPVCPPAGQQETDAAVPIAFATRLTRVAESRSQPETTSRTVRDSGPAAGCAWPPSSLSSLSSHSTPSRAGFIGSAPFGGAAAVLRAKAHARHACVPGARDHDGTDSCRRRRMARVPGKVNRPGNELLATPPLFERRVVPPWTHAPRLRCRHISNTACIEAPWRRCQYRTASSTGNSRNPDAPSEWKPMHRRPRRQPGPVHGSPSQ